MGHDRPFCLNWSARLTGRVAIITTLAKVKTGPRMSIVSSDRRCKRTYRKDIGNIVGLTIVSILYTLKMREVLTIPVYYERQLS